MDDLDYFDQVDYVFHRVPQQKRNKPKHNLPKHNPMETYDEPEFRRRYRMSKASFHKLLNLIRKDLEWIDKRNHPISPETQLLVALRFYGTGTFQLVQGDLLGISQPSISRIVRRVSEAIAKHRETFISFPAPHECQEVIALLTPAKIIITISCRI